MLVTVPGEAEFEVEAVAGEADIAWSVNATDGAAFDGDEIPPPSGIRFTDNREVLDRRDAREPGRSGEALDVDGGLSLKYMEFYANSARIKHDASTGILTASPMQFKTHRSGG